MTNFDRLKPHFEVLFGKGWPMDDYIVGYQASMEAFNCDGCIVGIKECTHRMGMHTLDECASEEEWDKEQGNGKICFNILKEWMLEEVKQ